MVPKAVKNIGILGVVLIGWTMWRAGVLVPYVNDYTPEVFATERPATSGAQDMVVGVSVDPITVYGTPFDGADVGGVWGPIFASGGFSSPPDMTLCLITLKAERPNCQLRHREGAPTSYCVNAYECEWVFEVPAGRIFGLVLMDVDTSPLGGSWDYMDTVLVLNAPTQAQFDALDTRIRTFISYVAPTHLDVVKPAKDGSGGWQVQFDRQEKYRREKSFPFFSPSEIAEGVRLVQSGLRITIPN